MNTPTFDREPVLNGSFFVPSFFDYLHIGNLRIINSQVKSIGCNIKYHDLSPLNEYINNPF